MKKKAYYKRPHLLAQSCGCGVWVHCSPVTVWVAAIGFISCPAASFSRVQGGWRILARYTTLSSSSTGLFFIFRIFPKNLSNFFNPNNIHIFLYFNISDRKIPGSQCIYIWCCKASFCCVSKKLLLIWWRICAFYIQCYLIIENR